MKKIKLSQTTKERSDYTALPLAVAGMRPKPALEYAPPDALSAWLVAWHDPRSFLLFFIIF
jgi:hypothetical protein